ALGACDNAAEPAPSPEPSEMVSASPSVSIIRPDVATPSAVVDLPPPPLMATIGFPDGGAELDEAARADLATVLASEQLAEGWPVVLRGHADTAGNDADNLAVSSRRAKAVANYLVDHGVAEDRIAVIALGEQNPAAPNAHLDGTPDEAGRAKNRRVVLTIERPGSKSPSAKR
ncbi:MAG TPA: OmpA family protein, partial [Croceibacterium sp.]|nr:OmpA family protein [Croceibacterium sp.]